MPANEIAKAQAAAGAYVGQWRIALRDFIGSRLFVAITAVFALMFVTQGIVAPGRLPPVEAPPLTTLGLVPAPPQLPLLPEVKTQLDKALAAASPYAQDALIAAAQKEQFAHAVNYGGAGASLVLCLVGLYLQWRIARQSMSVQQWWAAK
jgi:hypothetical protein